MPAISEGLRRRIELSIESQLANGPWVNLVQVADEVRLASSLEAADWEEVQKAIVAYASFTGRPLVLEQVKRQGECEDA